MKSMSVAMSAALTLVVLLLVAWAVREDLLRRRIPNALCFAALMLGLGMMSIAGGLIGLLYSAGGVLVGLLTFVPFYLLRGMGAGDVKLMAALGSFFGPAGALLAAAISLVAGGVYAIVIAISKLLRTKSQMGASSPGAESPTASQLAAVFAVVRKERFPYSVAIATGVVGSLWLRGSLRDVTVALAIG